METTSPPPPPTTTTTATTTTPTTTITSHPADPPDHLIQVQPNNLPPPFTNGVLKRHKPRHHQQHNPIIVTYKECLKNHAATMGGHAVDGCGEFMPSPTSVPTDPTSLKCAACGCHRNFHRREPDEVSFLNTNPIQHVIEYQPHHRHHPPPPQPPPQPLTIAPPPPQTDNTSSPAESPSPPPISSSYYPSAPHMLLALSTGAAGGTVSAPPHMENTSGGGGGGGLSFSNPNSKKRFRTKFTQDQKQKMHELAERVGWKMQKKDEDLILGFCNEIGVDKGVFKVWMHNNKMTLGNIKKDTVTSHTENHNGSSGGIGIGIDFLSQRDNNNNNQQLLQHQHQHQHQQQQNDSVSSGGGNVIGTNASSSSS